MHFGKKILFFSLVAVSAFFFAGQTRAINTGTVGILPGNPDPAVKYSSSWFIYKLDLGKSKNDSVRVINNKPETIVAKLYAVDATTTSDGSFALLPEDAERKDVGSWVKLAASEVEVPPNSEKSVPFVITIPEDTDVGDHMGGIIMQEVEGKGKTMAGTGVKIITRVGVRIYETVPGEVKKDFEITRFDWRTERKRNRSFFKDLLDLNKRTALVIGLKNKGNVKLTPKATVEVRNMFGKKVADLRDKEIGTIFPQGENKDATVFWESAPLIGRYKATLTANFFEEGIGSQKKDIVIWAFPYRIVFVLVLIGILLYLLRLSMLYFREARKEKMPIYEVRSGETLAALAHKFSVHWKKLAKINGLRKPFEVRAGQKLFIPTSKLNIDLLVKMVESGQLNPPLEGKGKAGQRRKKIIIAVVVIAILAGAAAWYKYKQRASVSNSGQQAGQNQEAAPEENQEKTATGAVKKSGIKVGIFTPADADPGSGTRLLEKLRLAGYSVSAVGDISGRSYSKTTVEYSPAKQEQAEILKNDLGASNNIELKEVANIATDVIVYNLFKKDDLLDIGNPNEKVSARRDLINIKLLSGGADEEKISKIKALIFQAGFSVEDEVGEAQQKNNQGLKIAYSDDLQKGNAEALKSFLSENGYQTSLEKSQNPENQNDKLILVLGKI